MLQNRINFMKLKLFFFLIIFAVSSVKLKADNADYLTEIKTLSEFNAYKGKPLSDKYGQVDALKIVYDIHDNKMYFIQSEKYVYHYDFCKNVLHFPYDLDYFNQKNYGNNPNRKYILASINYYDSKKIYTLEFAGWEKLDAEIVQKIYSNIASKVYFKNSLYYFPSNEKQVEISNELDKSIKKVSISDIYGNQVYQALNTRETYGYLKIVDASRLEQTKLTPNDILLINSSPNEVPVIAGMITTQFQTPLSHITILAQNRNTPLMAMKNILSNEKVMKMRDRLVYFKVSNDTFELRKAELIDAMKFWNETKKKLTLKNLIIDSSKKEIYPITSLSLKSISFVGAKAANFAELSHVVIGKKGNIPIPNPAFAIPFHFYLSHIKNNKIDTLIKTLLTKIVPEGNSKKIHEQLKLIRASIKSGKIDENFIQKIHLICKTEIPSTHIRFRSSTNAEDIEGFNGAGLYTSKSAKLGDNKKTIERAIKVVWASLWNERAFYEREYFNIDQNNLAMGILVHQSFPDEYSNGVAITKNIYRKDFPAIILNIQKGNEAVVNPSKNIVCDQIICYDKNDTEIDAKDRVEYISYSNLNYNLPINTASEIVELSEILKAVKDHYYYKLGKGKNIDYANYGLDFEFKFLKPDKRIILKQVRPYRN